MAKPTIKYIPEQATTIFSKYVKNIKAITPNLGHFTCKDGDKKEGTTVYYMGMIFAIKDVKKSSYNKANNQWDKKLILKNIAETDKVKQGVYVTELKGKMGSSSVSRDLIPNEKIIEKKKRGRII